jgi:hypothetical protein
MPNSKLDKIRDQCYKINVFVIDEVFQPNIILAGTDQNLSFGLIVLESILLANIILGSTSSATTHSKTTFSIMILRITTFRIMTLSMMTFRITTNEM